MKALLDLHYPCYPQEDLSGHGSNRTEGFITAPQQPAAFPFYLWLLQSAFSIPLVASSLSLVHFDSILTSLSVCDTQGVQPCIDLSHWHAMPWFINTLIPSLKPCSHRLSTSEEKYKEGWGGTNQSPLHLKDMAAIHCHVIMTYQYKYAFHVYHKLWNSMLGNRWTKLVLDWYSSYKIKIT